MSESGSLKSDDEIASLKDLNRKLESELEKYKRNSIKESNFRDIIDQVKELGNYINTCLSALPREVDSIIDLNNDFPDDIEAILKLTRNDITLLVGHLFDKNQQLNVILCLNSRISNKHWIKRMMISVISSWNFM